MLPPIPLPSRLSQAGFSLIEIILALGIISFALVGILGLFPVAVDAAANSQRETQAALIARSIFEQLETTPEAKDRVINLAETFDSKDPAPISVDLERTNTLAPIIFNADGGPVSSAATNSIPSYQALVSIEPITTPDYKLSEVSVKIKPITAPKVSYTFTSILRQQ